MVRQNKKEEFLEWAFPGGKVELRGSKEQACVREVFKKTCFQVKTQSYLVEREISPFSIYLTYFVCNYVDGKITI